MNQYQYCPNPVEWVDPLGLTAAKEDPSRQVKALAAKDHQLVIGAYSSSKTGHAVVALIDPNGKELMRGMTMSNYNGQKSDLWKALLGTEGELHSGSLSDIKNDYPDFATISTPINADQARNAVAKIEEYDEMLKSGDYKYSLLGRQCSSFACDVSNAAGVEPPNSGIITNPKSLHASINKSNGE